MLSAKQGNKITITIVDKQGIVFKDHIEYDTRPSVAIVETIKKILKHAAMNRWITHADLYTIIAYSMVLNIPRDNQQKIEWVQKELKENE